MKKSNIILGLSLASCAWLCSWANPALNTLPESMVAAPFQMATSHQYYDRANLVVDLADGMTAEQIASWQKRYGLELQYNSPYAGENALMVASVPERDMATLIQRLEGDEMVESAEPNYVVSLSPQEMEAVPDPKPARGSRYNITSYPNDPLFKHQWHLDMINAPFAWKFSQGRGAVVAVIDTGVAWKNDEGFVACEDLANTKIVRGYDFVNRNNLALDDNAHGTHVAGTIAQSTNNKIGVCGVAPQAAIMPIKVLSGAGSGRVSDIVDGIRFAADHGANVINMSLGGPLPSMSMARAVSYANSKGTLVVCAAGNEHRSHVGYPAGYKDSFVVSALNAKGELSWYSNYGKRVDIAAPGGDNRTDDNGDGIPDGVYQNTIAYRNPAEQGYYAFQGTSMATPHVSGAAAVLVGQGITNPDVLKQMLSRAAKNVCSDSRAKGYGAGMLDIGRAAFDGGYIYNAGRLVLAVLLAWACGELTKKDCLKKRLALVTSMMFGASGLFFLPLLFSAQSWLSWLAMPLPAWDTYFFGAGVHGNLVMCSALIPAALSMGVNKCRRCRLLLAGLTFGWAAYLLGEMITGATLLHFIPNCLAALWWLLNGVYCVCLARVLLSNAME